MAGKKVKLVKVQRTRMPFVRGQCPAGLGPEQTDTVGSRKANPYNCTNQV